MLKFTSRRGNAMQRIILDDEMRSKLNGLGARTALCDSTGQLVGFFITPESYAILVEVLDRFKAVDRAGLEAISSETGGRALSAIRADLQEEVIEGCLSLH
jgi:hypothetical protein